MYFLKIFIVFLIIFLLTLTIFSEASNTDYFNAKNLLISLIIASILTVLIKFIFKPFEGFNNTMMKKIKEKLDNDITLLTDNEKNLLLKVQDKEKQKNEDLLLTEEAPDDGSKIINNILNNNEKRLVDTTQTIVKTQIGKTIPLQKQDISLNEKDLEIELIDELQAENIDLNNKLKNTEKTIKRFFNDQGIKFDSSDSIQMIVEKFNKYGKNIMNKEHTDKVKEVNSSPFILLNSNNWLKQKDNYSKGCNCPKIGDLNNAYLDITKEYKKQK